MERPFDAFSPRCPSREVVDDVIGRWPALVLVALLDNPRRFADTARAVGGISDRMLSRTLTNLTNEWPHQPRRTARAGTSPISSPKPADTSPPP